MNMNESRYHTVLPLHAQDMLREAAMVHPKTPPGESRERTITLNHTIRKIKNTYPQHFTHTETEA